MVPWYLWPGRSGAIGNVTILVVTIQNGGTMKNRTHWAVAAGMALALLFGMTGCAPEVGSDAWCEKLKETPKGDWSTNDATNFAKHCVFK